MQKGVWYVVIKGGPCHYFEKHGHQRRPQLDPDIAKAPANGVLVVMGSAVEWVLDAGLHIVLNASQEGNGADMAGFVGSARKV